MDGKAFLQYTRCKFCKINHNKGGKHAYSKHHRSIISNILSKYEAKIKEAGKYLADPSIEKTGWEKDAKFWCYFCEKEEVKHTCLGEAVVRCGGLLHHLTLDEHNEKSKGFWKENRIQERERRLDFILEKTQYENFQVLAEKAVRSYINRHHSEIKQNASALRKQADQRHLLVQHTSYMQSQVKTYGRLGNAVTSHSSLQQTKSQHQQKSGETGSEQSQASIRTVSAHGPGLTCLPLKRSVRLDGNVHSGATPPWLQSDDDNHSSVIGPTLEDWKLHLKEEERAKLPSCRVGAKRPASNEASDASWMPSFGSVWSKQSRTHHRKAFMKSQEKLQRRTVPPSSTWTPSSHTLNNEQSQNSQTSPLNSAKNEQYQFWNEGQEGGKKGSTSNEVTSLQTFRRDTVRVDMDKNNHVSGSFYVNPSYGGGYKRKRLVVDDNSANMHAKRLNLSSKFV